MSSTSPPEPQPEFVSEACSLEQMESAEAAPVKNMRRFFSFRIKTLGLITGGFAGISWLVSLPFHESARNESVEKRVHQKDGFTRTETKTPRDGLRYIFKHVDAITEVNMNQRSFSDKDFSDEDLRLLHLAHADGLKSLELAGTNITDASISILAQIENLESLNIDNTHITNNGLRDLQKIPQLRSLFMFNMQHITDEGLKHLAAHPGLTHLSIGGPGITDTGLRYLENATHLKTIFITRCNATEEGFERLGKALPHCKVSRLYDWRYRGFRKDFPQESK